MLPALPNNRILARANGRRALMRGLVLWLVWASGLAWSEAASPAKRARPPKFPKSVQDVFFPDAREKLVGPRPASATSGAASTATTAAPSPANSDSTASWSKLITAEALEDEIKSQQLKLAATIENATRFKGGEYQQARAQLSLLAALLAIVADYDGQVRWKSEAASLGQLLGRAGANCKVASDASYKEARSRSDDLQNLVRGGSLQLPPADSATQWPQLADRGSLMKRLEQAQQQGILPLVTNAREFEGSADGLLHDAQIVAALSEVITREGYEFADDETYVEYSRAMRAQALALRDATLGGNYEQARQAASLLGQSCTNCHEGYRSQ
jgi:hypothetical protein